MKFRTILISLMILWDFILHITDFIGDCTYWVCPADIFGESFYWGSPLYHKFWMIYWGIALLISLSLIYSLFKKKKIESITELSEKIRDIMFKEEDASEDSISIKTETDKGLTKNVIINRNEHNW